MRITSERKYIKIMFSLVCLVLFSIVTTGTAQICGGKTVSLSGLTFTLFKVQNQNGIILNQDTYSQVVTTNPTTFIINGWLQIHTKPWTLQMKDKYLSIMLANIIIIDWSAYDSYSYNVAACAVPYVGKLVGDLIYNLTKTIGLNVGTVQINGFSLGAHVGGAAGARVNELGNFKINRINGLDAAGPGFAGKPDSQRLDASDAVFVQGIHTNIVLNGIFQSYGTIDFKLNYNILGCGYEQLGCPAYPGVQTDGSPLPYLFCDHLRAAAYYIESINSTKFLGVRCDSCTTFGLTTECSSNAKTIMGEMCPFDQSGEKFLSTNIMPPFAQG